MSDKREKRFLVSLSSFDFLLYLGPPPPPHPRNHCPNLLDDKLSEVKRNRQSEPIARSPFKNITAAPKE